MVYNMCRNFADTELSPIAGQLDAKHQFPEEQVNKLFELGMMAVCVDEQWGGSGMDTVSYAIGMEEISRGCASTGVIMSVNNSLYCAPVEAFGTDAQKDQFLRACTTGGNLGCFMLSEPGNGR
jgi:butyryl-CoA dehydrogenase